MEFTQTFSNDFTVLNIKGTFEVKTMLPLRQALEGLIEEGKAYIALNLGAVTYIDSSAVGLMLNFNKLIEKMDGYFCIFNIPDPIDDVLKITDSYSTLKIFKNEDDFKENTTI